MIIPSAPEFLESLLTTPSPTGYEAAGVRVWKEYVDEFADEVFTDAYGSCAAKVLTDKNAPTVLLEAHCDEIGMVVADELHMVGDGPRGAIYEMVLSKAKFCGKKSDLQIVATTATLENKQVT